MIKQMSTLVAVISLGGVLNIAAAGSLSIPTTFTSGTKAVAADVNGDFTAVKTAVNDNDSRIAKLEATIATLQASLKKVSGNTVLDLDKSLVYTTDVNGYPTAQFTGINVQVVNGTGQEYSLNGMGNLIVGYNNPRTAGSGVCTEGQYATKNLCTSNGGKWKVNFKTGSHNLVVGDDNSYSQYGGVVFGDQNVISGAYGVVSGGHYNIAGGQSSSVSGGATNVARGTLSSVSGGENNKASGQDSSVSGGRTNTASGQDSSVSGGFLNESDGYYSSVSGGTLNEASGQFSSVSGGQVNIASGEQGSVSGGSSKTAATASSWVAGSYHTP